MMSELEMQGFPKDDGVRKIINRPLRRHRRQSGVWNYFGHFDDDSGRPITNCAVCKLCRRRYHTTGGNTSNLHWHLQRKHPEISPLKSANSPGTIQKGPKRLRKQASSSHDRATVLPVPSLQFSQPATQQVGDNVHHEIARFFIANMLPLSTADQPSFRDMVSSLNINVVPPNGHLLQDVTLHEIHSRTMEMVQNGLKMAKGLTISMDIWMTHPENVECMTVSANVMSPEWESKTYVLCTQFLLDKEEDIELQLEEVWRNWNLQLPVTVVVTSEMKPNICEALKSSKCTFMPCFNHSIQRSVEAVLLLPEVLGVLSSVRKLVTYFLSSQELKQKLGLNILNLPSLSAVTQIVLDNSGDWRSTYRMLQGVTALDPAIVASLTQSEGSRQIPLNNKTLKTAKDILEVLQPIEMACNVLKSQSPPLASFVLPIISKVQREMAVEKGELSILNKMKSKFLEVLLGTYQEDMTRHVLLMASFLDHRFKKMNFVDDVSKQNARDLVTELGVSLAAANTDADAAYQTRSGRKIRKSAKQVMWDLDELAGEDPAIQHIMMKSEPVTPGYADNDDDESEYAPSDTSQNKDDGPLMMTVEVQFNDSAVTASVPSIGSSGEVTTNTQDWLNDLMDISGTNTAEPEGNIHQIQGEIDRYLLEKSAKVSPLEWWKAHADNYPNLSRVAVCLLSVPAVCRCNQHSLDGTGVNPRLLSLETAVNDEYMFLHHNFDLVQNA